jgi:hypothetical protein
MTELHDPHIQKVAETLKRSLDPTLRRQGNLCQHKNIFILHQFFPSKFPNPLFPVHWIIPAESELKSIEVSPGFAPLLLQLIASESIEIHIRFSAVVYFKNFVKRNWEQVLFILSFNIKFSCKCKLNLIRLTFCLWHHVYVCAV